MFKALFLALTVAAGWTTVSNQETAATEATAPLPMLSLGASETPQEPQVAEATAPLPAPLRLRKVEQKGEAKLRKATQPKVKVRTVTKPKALVAPKVRNAQTPAKVRVVTTTKESTGLSADEREALLGEIRRLQEENSRLQDEANGHKVLDRNTQEWVQLRSADREAAQRDRERAVEREARAELRALQSAERAAKAKHRAMDERARALEMEFRNLTELNRAEQAKAAELARAAEFTLQMNLEAAARLTNKRKQAQVRAERETEEQLKEVHDMAIAELLKAHGEHLPNGLELHSDHVQNILQQIAEGHGQTVEEAVEEAIGAQGNLWRTDPHGGDAEVHDILLEIAEGRNHATENAAHAELLSMLEGLDSKSGRLQGFTAMNIEPVMEDLEVLIERIECDNEDLLEGLELRLEGLEELCEQHEEACEDLIVRFEEEGGKGQYKVQLKSLENLSELKNLAVLQNLEGLKGLENLAVLEQLGDLGAITELKGLATLRNGEQIDMLRGLAVLADRDDECCEQEEECCEVEEECCDGAKNSVPFLSSIPTIENLFEGEHEGQSFRVRSSDGGQHVIIYGDSSECDVQELKGRVIDLKGADVNGRVLLRSSDTECETNPVSVRLRNRSFDRSKPKDTFVYLDANNNPIKSEARFPNPPTHFEWKSDGTFPAPSIWTSKVSTSGDGNACKGSCGTSVIKIQNQGGQVYIDTHDCKTEVSCDTKVNSQPAPATPGAPARFFFSTGSTPGADCPSEPCAPKAECPAEPCAPEGAPAPPAHKAGVSMRFAPGQVAPVTPTSPPAGFDGYSNAFREYAFASQSREADPSLAELERMLTEVLREVDQLQAEVDRVRVRVQKSQVR